MTRRRCSRRSVRGHVPRPTGSARALPPPLPLPRITRRASERGPRASVTASSLACPPRCAPRRTRAAVTRLRRARARCRGWSERWASIAASTAAPFSWPRAHAVIPLPIRRTHPRWSGARTRPARRLPIVRPSPAGMRRRPSGPRRTSWPCLTRRSSIGRARCVLFSCPLRTTMHCSRAARLALRCPPLPSLVPPSTS